jgi:DNA-binding MarR family transcriptional regulator
MRLPPSSGDPLVDAVVTTANEMRVRTNHDLQSCGLSLWTFKALRALDELGPSRSVDLAQRLRIAPRTVTGAVDALERDHLVERQSHPSDRRAHLLVVTPRGRKRLAEAVAVYEGLMGSATAAFDDHERAVALELLGRLSRTFASSGAAPVTSTRSR